MWVFQLKFTVLGINKSKQEFEVFSYSRIGVG